MQQALIIQTYEHNSSRYMKNLFILLLLAAACYYWFENNSNRSELENAKKQSQQLIQERDQAMQKLGHLGNTPPQTTSTEKPIWFQQRLQEKSALDQSNSRGQSSGHH